MEPKHKVQNSVQFKVKESRFTTDSEEVDSEYDTSVNPNHSINISKTSSLRCSGDINNSASSINTSILDDTEEIKILKEKVAELEAKCKCLGGENERIGTELTSERNRNQKLEKKLQFVKDNQEVFMRLKEAYINMKYNEAAGRKMIEIREKGMQTWEGILCRGCIQAEEMRRNIECIKEMYSDSYIIASYEMEQLLNTVKYLKDLIDRREKAWTSYMETEQKLHTHIKGLEKENLTLRDLIKNRNINIEDLHAEDTPREVPASKESVQLKKIIVKFEKKFRELEKNSSGQMKVAYPLNDKERKLVHYILAKYNSRLQGISCEKLRSRSASRETKKDTFNKLKSEPSYPRLKAANKDGTSMRDVSFKSEKMEECTAIMMMDHLFESESRLV